ncbi:hypothetical protein [Euzebya sp.]|uniref:hypothetical protein n=1 Tax=Euzebya sp. TaxID=1971409 RepID=UPI003511441B
MVTEDPAGAEHLERLAARMDAEVRAEQAAYEAMALQAERRARTLADVAAELVVRGDVVEVVAGREVMTGTAVHAGRDHMTLRAARGDVDLPLAGLTRLRVVDRVRAGGQSPRRGAKTFRARMTEHETAGVVVVVALDDGEQVRGVIAAAAEDHLLIASRHGDVVVPHPSVRAVWVPR